MARHIKDIYIHSQNTLLKVLYIFLLVIVPYGITVAQTLIPTDEKSNYAKQIKDLFDQSNWDAGKNILDEGIKKYPKESDLRMLAGKYYEHLKQHDKARYELNKALEYNPNNVSAKEILVNVETESGRYSSAICYINELLEITPYKPSLWQKKIQLYEFQGYTADANRLRKRISTIYPNDSIIQKDLRYHIELETEARRKDGKLDETISLSRELVQQQPGNAEYYLDLINDYLKAGDQNSAMIYTQRGLNKFPGNLSFIDKKTSFLAEQKRYSELLSFLQQEMKKGNSATLQQQYNYYLEEAAEEARNNDPATLYGRVLEHNPGNEEAFNYVFNSTMANLQYEEALNILNRYKKARGESKALTMKELMVYNRMGNTARVAALTKQLFGKYPEDSSLREAYVNIMLADAKSKMADNNYSEAIVSLNLVTQYGDEETQKDARHILYNAYMGMGDYNNALDILKSQGTNGPDILVKQADIYYKQQRYPMAVSAYEQAIDMVNGESKAKYIGGYSDMLTQIVKELNEQYLFDDAMKYIERWITYDTSNPLPLHYAVNLSYIRKKIDDVQLYAEKGYTSFPDDIFFKVKLAEIKVRNTQLYAETYNEVRESLIKNPYHKDLINAFAQLSEDYSKNLIKNKRSEEALSVIDTALYYSPANKSLKYMKGLALESIHRFDSAYYYQSFYDPSAMEIGEFRQHLNYLKYKSYRNEVGIYYMRNSFGDDNNAVSSVATIDYSRYTGTNTYVGRINYTGRDSGKGIQVQGEWYREWNQHTRSKIDVGFANKFFPRIALNTSIYRDLNIFSGIEAEFGAGYRKLEDKESLSNAVIGITKDTESWRVNVRFNNFLFQREWLYSLSANVRYYLSSPKNYLTAVASVGSSPDVDIINYQLYNGFSVTNSMVGAGIGHMITKTVSAGLLGTWYNFKANDTNYRNLYNLNFNINVAF